LVITTNRPNNRFQETVPGIIIIIIIIIIDKTAAKVPRTVILESKSSRNFHSVEQKFPRVKVLRSEKAIIMAIIAVPAGAPW